MEAVAFNDADPFGGERAAEADAIGRHEPARRASDAATRVGSGATANHDDGSTSVPAERTRGGRHARGVQRRGPGGRRRRRRGGRGRAKRGSAARARAVCCSRGRRARARQRGDRARRRGAERAAAARSRVARRRAPKMAPRHAAGARARRAAGGGSRRARAAPRRRSTRRGLRRPRPRKARRQHRRPAARPRRDDDGGARAGRRAGRAPRAEGAPPRRPERGRGRFDAVRPVRRPAGAGAAAPHQCAAAGTATARNTGPHARAPAAGGRTHIAKRVGTANNYSQFGCRSTARPATNYCTLVPLGASHGECNFIVHPPGARRGRARAGGAA